MSEQEEFEFRRRLEQEQAQSGGGSFGGAIAEAGKGLLRGASDVAADIGKAVPTLMLGPVAGELAGRGMEAIGAPSRELVAPRPESSAERFAGTAGEFAGASLVAGGGVRTAALSGVGAATGEQMGGELGKLLGSVGAILTGAGVSALNRPIARKTREVWDTIKAGFGSQKAINRFVDDIANRMAGEDKQRIISALKTAEEYVPGARPTVGEAITQAQPATEQFGGALVRLQRDLHGGRGIEDILPTTTKQQEAAVNAFRQAVSEKTAPLRERALRGASIFGVRPERILSRITIEARKPGFRASDVVQKSLGEIKDKINSLPGANFGRINPEDLYTVRKEIGNIISKHSKETQNWDKKLSALLERKAQTWIDDAIESAGGVGWRQYLSEFSKGMKAADAQEARIEAMKKIQRGVRSQAPSSGLAPEVPKPPTLLRPMMIANFVLRLLERDADTPVAREIAKKMRDPREFAKLLERPVADPLRQEAERLARQVSAAMAAANQ